MNTTAELLQTQQPPLDGIQQVRSYLSAPECNQVGWDHAALLLDEPSYNMVVCLFKGNDIRMAFRAIVLTEDSDKYFDLLSPSGDNVTVAVRQGYTFSKDDLSSISKLQESYNAATCIKVSKDNFSSQYASLTEPDIKTGRGADFSVKTSNAVITDSCNRCMYEGCGANLTEDILSGEKGNYHYLAHIVASSENGPRGIKGLSEKLSDDPQNVMLMCDKHHRLIDRIAMVDYPVERLRVMREAHVSLANKLLDHLAYTPAKVFCVLWPVAGQSVGSPTKKHIAECLQVSKLRISGEPQVVTNNDAIRDKKDDAFWSIAPMLLNSASSEIEKVAQMSDVQSGLFAIGPMPLLIGLGARLGNKFGIIPMLRFRETGRWMWPKETPDVDIMRIDGVEHLSDKESHVVIKLQLTNESSVIDEYANVLRDKYGAKAISVNARVYGNGSIGHPVEGQHLTHEMQKLLNSMKAEHAVEVVHLLPCASNVACVCVGQAIEQYCPNIIVYDFIKTPGTERVTLMPRLKIIPANENVIFESVHSTQ